MIKIYQVGGHVRDSLMGIRSKDIDYAVEAESFDKMLEWVRLNTKQVYLIKPEFLTIRALTTTNEAVDYVLCRKDGAYSDQRHPDFVEPGTIFDDLARRDFTINAMAIEESTGLLIDPHGGQEDIKNRLIRCVGNANERFAEDPLRIIRAIRFTITKDFSYDEEIEDVFNNPDFWILQLKSVSKERVREELTKCFLNNTPRTLDVLCMLHRKWREEFFSEIKLLPTMKG